MIVECTIPIVVKLDVTYNDDDMLEIVVRNARPDPDWGGFFSEAEEAEGVWCPEEDGWGHDYQYEIAAVARKHVLENGVPS